MRGRSFALFITFLCSLVITTHEANRKFAQRKNEDIDEDTAEQVWLHCRKELLEFAKGYDYSDFDIHLPASSGHNMVESDLGLLKKKVLHKTITDLPFHRKQVLLNCLDKEVIQSQTSRRNSALINWHKLFYDWSSVPRRFLQRKKNAPKPHQHPKQRDTRGKLTTVTARRAGVPSPPEPSSSRTTANARANPKSTLTTLNVKYDESSASSSSDAGTSPEASKDSTDFSTSGSQASLTEVSALRQIEKALEQLKTQEAESPAPKPLPTKNKNSPSPSPTKDKNSPSSSPTKDKNSPSPSPTKDKNSPSPSPTEDKNSPSPSPTKDKNSPSPSPTKDKNSPSPSPTKDKNSPSPSPAKDKNSPSPSPTKDKNSPSPSPTNDKNTPSPSPSKDKNSPSPSPEEDKNSPSPSPTKDKNSPSPSPSTDKNSPSPSPTKNKHSPSPSPTEDKNSPSPSPTNDKNTPSPSPTKDKNSPSPSPAEDKNSPSPSPTKDKNSPSPSPSTDKNSPSPSPTKNKHSPSPSPTERRNSAAPSPQERSESPAPSPLAKSKSPALSPSGKSEAPESSPKEESKSPETSPITSQSKNHVGKSSKMSKYKTSVVAGCSVTGAVVVAFVLFCGVSRRKKNEPIYEQPEDKPSFHFSAGSLQTSNGVAKSSKTGYNSPANGSNFNTGSGTPGASGDGKLPLPPGKVAASLASKAPPPPPTPSPPSPPPPPPPAPAAAAAAAAAPAAAAPEPPEPKAPPPPKVAQPPPQPPKPSPLGLNSKRLYSKNASEGSDDQKAKMKPFFWDKVPANPDQSMVWHDLKSGSFQYNEEMMENLFGYKAAEQNKNNRKKQPVAFEAPKYIQIIDPRKAQNLSIILKALNVTTEEVCDAILEGNELPSELIRTLLKMAPTEDEELKLRLYSEDLSKLGPAERFLKALVEIPFSFKRLESLLFMYTVEEEISSAIESFADIEVACNEIKNSRLFLKLLEAVLKTGNRMNDGTFRGGAQAFKLDTLLKLSDVKGTDGKTTLLHFVVLEIIRSEGIRAARKGKASKSITDVNTEDMLNSSTNKTAEYVRSLGIEIVSNLSNELKNVTKAAHVDGDVLRSTVLKLGRSLRKSKDFLNNEMNDSDEKGKFRETLASFVQQAEADISWLLEEEKKMSSLIQSTANYFHGNAGKDEGLHLFAVVRDFLTMVEKVVNEVKTSTKNTTKKMSSAASSPAQESKEPVSPTNSLQQRLFPAIKQQRRYDSSSSDDES